MTESYGISIIVPAYNEEENLEAAIGELLGWIRGTGYPAEIVIVDDGSRDGTAPIADRLSATHDAIRVVHHPINRGYGAALASGFAAATKPLVFFTDADRQFIIEEIARLRGPIVAGEADMVIGYRMGRCDTRQRILLSVAYNSLADAVFRTRAHDLGCAFKLMPTWFVRQTPLICHDFSINTELVVKARRRGLRVREVGVTHRPRIAGTSSVRLRHIGMGLSGLWALWRELHGLPHPLAAEPALATSASGK